MNIRGHVKAGEVDREAGIDETGWRGAQGQARLCL